MSDLKILARVTGIVETLTPIEVMNNGVIDTFTHTVLFSDGTRQHMKRDRAMRLIEFMNAKEKQEQRIHEEAQKNVIPIGGKK